MIRVACRCQHTWDVPDDQAGLSAQCPQCGLLNDIPAFGLMQSLDQDGTYKLDADATAAAADHFRQLANVYYPGRRHTDGSEIDLRGPAYPVPEEPIPRLSPDDTDPQSVDRPRYDPESGELIQPLDLRGQPAAAPPQPAGSDIPYATQVLHYNDNSTENAQTPHGMGVFLALFAPINLIVMSVLLLAHVFLLIASTVAAVIPLIIFAPLAVAAAIISHYAVVVEEIGIAEKDELPRPLRDVNLYDDLFAPFCRMVGAILICYWPSIIIHHLGPAVPLPGLWHLAIFLIGSFFAPAILLTVITSGTLHNLRPDRVLGTITQIGWSYTGLVLLWILAGSVYIAGQVGVIIQLGAMFSASTSATLITTIIAYPLLIIGIYLMHAFSWLLGLSYRAHYRQFPWVAQRHTRAPAPLCPKCGYNLTGNLSGVCPECRMSIPWPLRSQILRMEGPNLHPKLAAADAKARQRAAKRARSGIR